MLLVCVCICIYVCVYMCIYVLICIYAYSYLRYMFMRHQQPQWYLYKILHALGLRRCFAQHLAQNALCGDMSKVCLSLRCHAFLSSIGSCRSGLGVLELTPLRCRMLLALDERVSLRCGELLPHCQSTILIVTAVSGPCDPVRLL